MINFLRNIFGTKKIKSSENIKDNSFSIRPANQEPEKHKKHDPLQDSTGDNSIDQVVKGLTHYRETKTFSSVAGFELADELTEQDYFPEIDIEDELVRKIEELQSVTDNIDKIIISKPNLDPDRKFKIDYKNELNNQQLVAVTTTEIPLLVIAGAGSGKTRVITYKVSYLIEKGINPNQILLLTFTKKSANEMLGRVEKLLADKSISNVLGGTFHSFANFVLRKYGNLIGIPNNFSIIDTGDTADIIDLLKSELKITGKRKGVPFPKKTKVQAIISKSKNLEYPIETILKKYFNENLEYSDEIKILARALETYKKASNLMGYDDLLIILRDKLRDNHEFRNRLRDSIKYILVDEYQDTNNVQREIIEFLAGKSGRVTVVGDDSQSIYAFRGANFENILRFSQSFPNCGAIKIEENYRSEQGILNFTNDIILNARIGFRKKLFSQRFTGKKPFIKRLADGPSEAEYIIDKVMEIRDNNVDFSDFAILTRASWHSNYVQSELTRRNIPFVVVGGIKFSERRHIKDIIAFIKISINPLDAVAWHRILQLIEGIGKVRAKEIVDLIHKKNGIIDLSEFANRKYFGDLNSLQNLFNRIIEGNHSVSQTIDLVFDYYKPVLKQVEDDFELRFKDLEIFSVIAGKYDNIDKFITDFTLEPPSNRYQDETVPMAETGEKPLVVSTIHSAKGLEWHTVFLPFALDGLMPSSRSMGSIEEIEEERRLFYVAASRAKENLFITMPSYVSSWDAVFTKPSRFIYDINKDHYRIEG